MSNEFQDFSLAQYIPRHISTLYIVPFIGLCRTKHNTWYIIPKWFFYMYKTQKSQIGDSVTSFTYSQILGFTFIKWQFILEYLFCKTIQHYDGKFLQNNNKMPKASSGRTETYEAEGQNSLDLDFQYEYRLWKQHLKIIMIITQQQQNAECFRKMVILIELAF